MSDPNRSKIYFALADRPAGATVRQLSQRLDETPRRVRYHLDAMVDQDLVVVVERNNRRGAVERVFRAVRQPVMLEEQGAALSLQQSRQITLQIFRFALAEATRAVAAGTFWRAGYVEARAEGEVDEQGWSELAAIQLRTLQELEGVLERSRQRCTGSDGNLINAVIGLWLFEAPEWPE